MSQKMSKEALAVLADDIASMTQEFIDARDANSLRNMATNLANMIRIHWPTESECEKLREKLAEKEQIIINQLQNLGDLRRQLDEARVKNEQEHSGKS